MAEPKTISKETLIRTALKTYEASKKYLGLGDREMCDRTADDVRDQLRAGETPSVNPLYFITQEGMLNFVANTKWAHCGFPSIAMGHRYAAALLSTTATVDAVKEARPPFQAFVIDLPDDLLHMDDPEKHGQRLAITRLLVTRLERDSGDVWGFIAYSEAEFSLYRHGQTSEDLLPPDSVDGETHGDAKDPFDLQVTDRDNRVLYLLGRLVINTCLAMSDPENVRAVGKSHEQWAKHSSGTKRSSPEPIVRVFQLGKPIQHDCREAVEDYLEGRRRKLSVQTLVRGHFKTQHYGPKNVNVKVIWREPFWRGPEDAPIPIRSHVLSKP